MRSGPRVRLRGGRAGRDDDEHVGATSWNPARSTDVTESFELADTPLMRLYWMVAGFARGRTTLDGMRVTWKGSRQSPNPPVLPGRPDAEAPGCRCATRLQNAVHGRAPGGMCGRSSYTAAMHDYAGWPTHRRTEAGWRDCRRGEFPSITTRPAAVQYVVTCRTHDHLCRIGRVDLRGHARPARLTDGRFADERSVD